MLIQDGKGKNGSASVSSDQRLHVSAKSTHRAFYISRDDGLAFNAVMDPISATANDIIGYIKNTSDRGLLIIDSIEFHSLNAAAFRIWSVTGTAAAGESVTPSNLNRSSGRPAAATAMKGDTAITGLTTGAQLGSHRCPAAGDSSKDFKGALILGPGDAIAIEYESGTAGACTLDIIFHEEIIGDT